MTKVLAETLKIGNKIMPPAREVRLWMRRDIQQRGLPESALHLTITDICEADPDKGGRWLLVKTQHSTEWNEGRQGLSFNFKVRPQSPWPLVA